METLPRDVLNIIHSFIPHRQFHELKYQHVTKYIQERGHIVEKLYKIAKQYNTSLPKNVYRFCSESRIFVRIVGIVNANSDSKLKKSIFYTQRVIILTKPQYTDICGVSPITHATKHTGKHCNCAYNIYSNDTIGVLRSKSMIFRLFKIKFILIYVA